MIAGHDRDFAAALAWVDAEAAARVCPGEDALRAHLGACLAQLNEAAGSASRIERLLVLEAPPDMDAGEITDKGYVNQRRVLERRAALVERLFAEPADAAVIVAAAR